MRVVDIHCHILPGFDDGAADMADAMAMLRMASRCGITDVVATPHFPGTAQFAGSLGRLYARFRRLEETARREKIPVRLYPGAEILCLPETVELARERKLPTLGDTDYLLLEFYFDMPFEALDGLLDAVAAQGYIPVVAHPERYEAILDDPRGVEEWFRRGYVIQLNKGSLLGAFGYRVQKTAQWILRGGLAHLVASDAHSAVRRTPDMTQLRRQLLEEYPYEYVQLLLERNPERLIRGEPMVSPESF